MVRPRQPRDHAPEQRVVAVAHPLLVVRAQIVERAGLDDVGGRVGRLVLVADKRLGEYVQGQPVSEVGHRLRDGELGVAGEGAGGGEGGEGVLVAHEVPEAGAEALREVLVCVFERVAESADLDDFGL